MTSSWKFLYFYCSFWSGPHVSPYFFTLYYREVHASGRSLKVWIQLKSRIRTGGCFYFKTRSASYNSVWRIVNNDFKDYFRSWDYATWVWRCTNNVFMVNWLIIVWAVEMFLSKRWFCVRLSIYILANLEPFFTL